MRGITFELRGRRRRSLPAKGYAAAQPTQEGTDMKMWIDTEFNEYRGELISLALVAEDGREWYGVRYCDAPGWWVKE